VVALTDMRIGVMIPPAQDLILVPEFALRAEDAGFDFVAAGEHLFFHGPVHNAFVALAAAAAVTTRIRLVSALTVLPFYSPVLVAKLASDLDRLSGGRFDLGVGVGGEYSPEFAAAGADIRRRGRDADESLTALRQLFTGDVVRAAGAGFRVDGLRLDPAPVQPGGPPIWVGGRKQAALRRAARFGDVWFPYAVSPEHIGRGLAELAPLLESHGRQPSAVRAALFAWGAVAATAATAKATAIGTMSNVYQQDFTPIADRTLVTGTPAEVVDRIGSYRDNGVRDFLFAPAGPDAVTTNRMTELFAAEVLPQLRVTTEREGNTHDDR
jgi:probable F420-dependent oxidoreductase